MISNIENVDLSLFSIRYLLLWIQHFKRLLNLMKISDVIARVWWTHEQFVVFLIIEEIRGYRIVHILLVIIQLEVDFEASGVDSSTICEVCVIVVVIRMSIIDNIWLKLILYFNDVERIKFHVIVLELGPIWPFFLISWDNLGVHLLVWILLSSVSRVTVEWIPENVVLTSEIRTNIAHDLCAPYERLNQFLGIWIFDFLS